MKPKAVINISEKVESTVFERINSIPGLDFKHKENDFIDFERDRLLFQMLSNEGPHLAVGDVNGDGMEDLYLCGAKDTHGSLFVQEKNGSFRKTNEKLFEADRISEDTDCAFFDADGDGDSDLYVASGGNEFPSSSSALLDRLYINDGKGIFSKSPQMLPVSEYMKALPVFNLQILTMMATLIFSWVLVCVRLHMASCQWISA